MASILDLWDEFSGVAKLNYPEHKAFPNSAFNRVEVNMSKDILDVLDPSVSPVSLLNFASHYSDVLYIDSDSDISEQIARLQLTPQVIPNLSDLTYNNYNSDSSSSNINRMPPVPSLHLRLDRNAKNSANESNTFGSDAHTPKKQYLKSYAAIALENLQMEEVLPHGRSTTPVDSTEQFEDASQLDKCQGQLNGENSEISLKKVAKGRREQEKKTYPCAECNKSFTRKDRLTSHLKTHLGGKQFKCAVCGVGFRKQQFLTVHEKIHFGVHCSICDAVFEYKSQLDCHLSTHTGVRPYKCDVCKKTYTQRFSLSRHRKSHKM